MKVIVRNGTNAGCKPPLKPKSGSWFCRCLSGGTWGIFKEQRGYLIRCPDCHACRDGDRS